MDKNNIKQLVSRAKSGNDEAFTKLVEIYSDRIYNLALRILHRNDDAADVVQETFVKVYEKIKTFEYYYDRPNSVEIQEWQSFPLNNMLTREFRAHLDRAVESLPEIYRSVFVLRDLENMSTRETSKILGITETNVKVRLKRARMYLREKLAEYMHEFIGVK